MTNFKPEAQYTSIGVINGQGYLGYKVKYIKDGNTEYFGYAPCGVATNIAKWTIKKIVSTSSTIDITWANSGEDNSIWDNYATLNYS